MKENNFRKREAVHLFLTHEESEDILYETIEVVSSLRCTFASKQTAEGSGTESFLLRPSRFYGLKRTMQWVQKFSSSSSSRQIERQMQPEREQTETSLWEERKIFCATNISFVQNIYSF